jgi:hypothetical protein
VYAATDPQHVMSTQHEYAMIIKSDIQILFVSLHVIEIISQTTSDSRLANNPSSNNLKIIEVNAPADDQVMVKPHGT